MNDIFAERHAFIDRFFKDMRLEKDMTGTVIFTNSPVRAQQQLSFRQFAFWRL